MWYDIEGHDDIAERFRLTLRRNRLASTYLFVGPAGIGKRRFAEQLAHSVLCGAKGDDLLGICGRCESCRLARAGNHPDLLAVGLPDGKSTLPLELFLGDRDHRHQTGLCHHLSLKPFLGDRRVAIIDDADHFSQESANCLLKTLEEPPPHSLLILVGTSPSRQLPTIRSRSQLVRFSPLANEIVERLLTAEEIVATADEAARLASISEGSLARARELADPELWQFRDHLVAWLEDASTDPARTTKAVLQFVDAAGKEASARRGRLRTVLGFAVEHYRDRMRSEFRIRHVERLDRCLLALEYVDRNANQASLVYWWVGEIAQ
jgi:DNA polymerase-3 subunit delta'